MGPRGEKEQKRSPNGVKRSMGFMVFSWFFKGPHFERLLGGFWGGFGEVLERFFRGVWEVFHSILKYFWRVF